MSQSEIKKILIGGVPFGRDNVGDEAILECVVSIVKSTCPIADIWVSTDDQEATQKKLNVNTVPLFGFDPPGFDRNEMLQTIGSVDAFIWAGATGLSDYPEIPLQILQYACDKKKKAVIFCTGMNTQLNPFLYRLLPGGRLKLFSLIRRLSFGLVDLIAQYEARKKHRATSMIKNGIESSGLVVLRDAQSLDAIQNHIGKLENSVLIGADPAIEILPKSIELSGFSKDVLQFCGNQNRKIGLCISAQSPMQQLDELADMFNRLNNDFGINVIGIPMNPITDYQLMNNFRETLQHPECMCVAEGRYEPDEIAGLASQMDVVISSRLHLLILASITLTPFIGISRGTKVTNFTSQFDLPEIGSVDSLNMNLLEDEILRLLNNRKLFENKAGLVREQMLKRLELSKSSLSSYLLD